MDVEGKGSLRGLLTCHLGLLDKFFESVEADVASAVVQAVQHIIKLSPLFLTSHPEKL